MPKKARNVFAIRSRLQLKFAILLFFSMLIPAIFVGICMYSFIFIIVTEGMGVPESVGYNLFPVLQKINLMMSVGLFVIFVAFLMIGIYISNKLIGPVDRIKRDLKKIADGDGSVRLKMRKGDDLGFIADTINRILDKKKP